MSVLFAACPGGDDPDSPLPPQPNVPGPTNNSESSNSTTFQVQTEDASDITENSAKLGGSFTTTNRQPDNIGFLLGTSPNLSETSHDRDLVIFDISSSFSTTVDGLQPHTTYYYCAYVRAKDDNIYTFGDTKSFVTNGGNGNNGESLVPKGSGTLSSPYNVAAITEIANRLRAGEIDATDYYFEGRISQITYKFGENDTTATFHITDGNGTNQFLCKGVNHLHNTYSEWVAVKNISIGDDVVIFGKITRDYNDVVCTSSGRAYLYSLNNDTGTTDAIEYSIGGRTFRTVLVEGGPTKPFYIMQTEIPINADLTINNRVVTPLDINGDTYIIASEFSAYLLNIRSLSCCPFRLPTKEEWQFAARGGNRSMNYIYSGSDSVDDVAWHNGNSDKKVHDVAQKKANELGLYDMSGNYAEVCFNPNAKSDYSFARERDVDGPLCGGSWHDAASDCTVNSWQNGSVKGSVDGYGSPSEKNCINGKYVTVRLVYTKW